VIGVVGVRCAPLSGSENTEDDSQVSPMRDLALTLGLCQIMRTARGHRPVAPTRAKRRDHCLCMAPWRVMRHSD
jgi:hypothetical protein